MDFSEWKLSKSHQKVAEYISKNREKIPYMTEKDISAAAGVSIATVSRFWENIGFENLRDYKSHLKEESIVTPASKVQTAVRKSSTALRTDPIIDDMLVYLQEMRTELDDDTVETITKALLKARVIHLYGTGSSQSLVYLLRFRLRRFGLTVLETASSGHELYEDMVHMQEDDVLIIFGFVRSSPEIDVLFDYAEKIGMYVLLITDMHVISYRERASYVLYTNRGGEADFHSMVAPTAVLEILIIQIGKQLGEKGLNELHKLHALRKQYQKRLPKQ
jgi:DNA-binding MurR/RpiR family transcriptional regulator